MRAPSRSRERSIPFSGARTQWLERATNGSTRRPGPGASGSMPMARITEMMPHSPAESRTRRSANWYLLGGVEVPLTNPEPFDYQVVAGLMKVF